MKKLDANWLTTGSIDFEYKKYILLSYLQFIGKNFNERKLYPFLHELIGHYKNLLDYEEKRKIALNEFPRKISRLDFQNFKLEYEKLSEDNKYISEINKIVDFAIPKIFEEMSIGTELYDHIMENLLISPVGVLPFHKEEGYLFILPSPKKNTMVYEYHVTIFESADEKFKGIRTNFVGDYEVSISQTIENIKFNLIKTKKDLPVPATYLVESNLLIPVQETILPLAKRLLVRSIYEN